VDLLKNCIYRVILGHRWNSNHLTKQELIDQTMAAY